MRDTPKFFDKYSRKIVEVTQGSQEMFREVVVEGGTAQHANGMILAADELGSRSSVRDFLFLLVMA